MGYRVCRVGFMAKGLGEKWLSEMEKGSASAFYGDLWGGGGFSLASY